MHFQYLKLLYPFQVIKQTSFKHNSTISRISFSVVEATEWGLAWENVEIQISNMKRSMKWVDESVVQRMFINSGFLSCSFEFCHSFVYYYAWRRPPFFRLLKRFCSDRGLALNFNKYWEDRGGFKNVCLLKGFKSNTSFTFKWMLYRECQVHVTVYGSLEGTRPI